MLKLIKNQEQKNIIGGNKTWQYLHVTLQKRRKTNVVHTTN
ncbi:hypothetical protein SGADD03_00667 [Streptococcus gallolyticus]|uniref:Uncharacterized protein n=1 Tax=Streptococcus gallolyticus TaxID=315405 RepID=A0A139R496_9STRE|nr:hypothetical protein SGADD03_00667 [Streptococcus gallolyticus]